MLELDYIVNFLSKDHVIYKDITDITDVTNDDNKNDDTLQLNNTSIDDKPTPKFKICIRLK
jgi:hypothetical protein